MIYSVFFRILIIVLALASCTQSPQPSILQPQIEGHFPALAGKEIRLEGFSALNTFLIDSYEVDSKGYFQLNYENVEEGVGYLTSEGESPYFVILSGEKVVLKGENLSNTERIEVLEGQDNQRFAQYAREQPVREQAAGALRYLQNLYENQAVLNTNSSFQNSNAAEMKRLKDEEAEFLAQLPANSYIRWFLPMRKMVATVNNLPQQNPDAIPATIKEFRNLDHSDPRLLSSGLYRDVLDGHYWLIENSGKPLEKVFEEMKKSIDILLEQLRGEELLLNETVEHLFNMLESRSLFPASEHLALQVLNDESCVIDEKTSFLLESYRAMKIGNTAPDLRFNEAGMLVHSLQTSAPSRLSDIAADYTLVAFGKSTCPKCQEDKDSILKHYPKWKQRGVEVVYVSLDTDQEAFYSFVEHFPFLSISDLKGWDSTPSQQMYVFATPTYYLLDKEREIVLRPGSVQQIDAWVEWYLSENKM
jgi:peroxiredoxin